MAQIKPVGDMSDDIREAVFGQVQLGPSRTYSVEVYFDQLSELPPEQAATIFDQIAETDPDLAKKIVKIVKERQKGITAKDKDLKAKGVADGKRALAIQKQFDKLETDKEKASLWDEYVRKGVITKIVFEQLMLLRE